MDIQRLANQKDTRVNRSALKQCRNTKRKIKMNRDPQKMTKQEKQALKDLAYSLFRAEHKASTTEKPLNSKELRNLFKNEKKKYRGIARLTLRRMTKLGYSLGKAIDGPES